MSGIYEISMIVNVHDEEALFAHAVRAFLRNRPASPEAVDEVYDHLLDEDGNPDVTQCLRMILDPDVSPDGCEIQDSMCE